MDVGALNSFGRQPLQATLSKIATANTKEALFEVAVEIAQTGPSFLTAFFAYADQKNPETSVLHAHSPELTFPDIAYYADETFQEYEDAYRVYIAKTLGLAGVDPHYGTTHTGGTVPEQAYAVNTIVRIERATSSIVNNLVESDDPDFTYNPMRYSDAAAEYPLTFGAFATGLDLLAKSTLTDSSTVIIDSLEYFGKAEEFVATLDLKDLKAYLMFHDLIDQSSVQRMFDSQRRELVKRTVELVIEAMGEHIEKLSWSDAATRAGALTKLEKKVSSVVPELSQTKMPPFAMDRKAFFGNTQKLRQHNFDKSLQQIGNHFDWAQLEPGVPKVDAYYEPATNQIVLPAGIFKYSFFDDSTHPSQNYGAIGAMISHELTHAFDNYGRLYYGNGNRGSWWTPESSDAFDARAQCFVDQYNAFVINDEDGSLLGDVNGTSTVTENIADNGGLSLAYDAYQKYITSPEAVVPSGTEVSEEEANQLFFVSFGQSLCARGRDDDSMEKMLSVPECMSEQWRVNGAVMNNGHFAKVFKCKAGSKMNPEKKCAIR